jgi:glyoxylase-like metal-dependent hydrolase (beta-lactamase superfamily II)
MHNVARRFLNRVLATFRVPRSSVTMGSIAGCRPAGIRRLTVSSSSPDLRSRRDFLRVSAGCGAHLLLFSALWPQRASAVFGATRGRIVAREPWGRIEQVADGIWAMISTPLEDRTTLCNGGIIRGSSGVVAIETFAQPAGASWLAGKARELTGRWPDHVILTHYHGDHSGGAAGYVRDDGTPPLHATIVTRDLVGQADAQRAGQPPDPVKKKVFDESRPIDAERESILDLGDRQLRIVPRAGHTRSDVSIEIDDPSVVFCGDLMWNRMFPNYVDAIPSRLSRDVRALTRERSTTYVPGHGPLADDADMRRYTRLLDSVGQAAMEAKRKGLSAAEAAKTYEVPADLGEWTLFSPRYYETAIGAWLRESA